MYALRVRNIAVFEIGRGRVYGLFAVKREAEDAAEKGVKRACRGGREGGKKRPRVRVSLLIYNAVSAR